MGRESELPDCAKRWLADWTAKAAGGLAEGWVVEVAPAAVEWWQQAARALRQGYLLAADYGRDSPGGEFSGPRGTLRAFRSHRLEDDVLQKPGEQDITAHVPWGLIRAAGEEAGLSTLEFMEQGRWLSRILGETAAAGVPLPAWSPAEVRQFHTLSHPGYLGAKFQVLVQTKAISGTSVQERGT
jgi:SAM-dependent MidA family methyltransferase